MTAKDILLAVIIPLALAELGPWCGWLAARVLPLAAKLRYGDTERAAVRLEEWSGDLNDIPGQLTKLAYAFGQLAAGSVVSARRKTARRSRLGGTNVLLLMSRGPADWGDNASQRREAGSFEDFFTEWYPRVVAFLMQRMAGATEADAHDAAQNAMIQLFRCWDRLDYPKAYLFKVVLREAAPTWPR